MTLIFWIFFSILMLLTGSYLGMGYQLFWLVKNDMMRPECYPPKLPWWMKGFCQKKDYHDN